MTCFAANYTLYLEENKESDPYRRSLHMNVIGSSVTLLIAITSLLGNSAVVTVSYLNDQLRDQAGNLLIVYLALTDIMTALFVMIPSAIAVAFDNWPLGMSFCRAHATINYTFYCSSSFNISLISIDRLVAVLYPLRYLSLVNIKLMKGLCIWQFVQSLVVCLTCAIPDWMSYNYKEGVCAVEYMGGNDSVLPLATFWSFFCFFGPVIAIGVCNTIIIITAQRNKNRIQPFFVRRATLSELRMHKTIKSLLAVVLTYVVCYTPYSVIKLMKIHTTRETPAWLDYMTSIICFIASAANPFIYGIFRKDYRKAFKTLIRMLAEKFSP